MICDYCQRVNKKCTRSTNKAACDACRLSKRKCSFVTSKPNQASGSRPNKRQKRANSFIVSDDDSTSGAESISSRETAGRSTARNLDDPKPIRSDFSSTKEWRVAVFNWARHHGVFVPLANPTVTTPREPPSAPPPLFRSPSHVQTPPRPPTPPRVPTPRIPTPPRAPPPSSPIQFFEVPDSETSENDGSPISHHPASTVAEPVLEPLEGFAEPVAEPPLADPVSEPLEGFDEPVAEPPFAVPEEQSTDETIAEPQAEPRIDRLMDTEEVLNLLLPEAPDPRFRALSEVHFSNFRNDVINSTARTLRSIGSLTNLQRREILRSVVVKFEQAEGQLQWVVAAETPDN